MADPRPSNPIFPDPPLTGDPQMTAWAQEITGLLNSIIVTFNIPGLVTGFTATANNTVIVLRWNATRQASQYRIYRNTSGEFNTATVIASIPASKTGVASLSYQDGQDQTEPKRYYWIVGVNERGLEGPKSQMVTIENFATADTSAAFGVDAEALGERDTVVGVNSTTPTGGSDNTVVGYGTTCGSGSPGDNVLAGANITILTSAQGNVVIGEGSSFTATSTQHNNLIGHALTTGGNAITLIGHSITSALGITGSFGLEGTPTESGHWIAGGNDGIAYQRFTLVTGTNGQAIELRQLTELLTVAAAATTDTTIQIPANTIVKYVSVRTTTAIPTASTYTVTGATSGTTFNTAAVSTAVDSTDKGNAAGAYVNTATQAIRITPDLTPADNTGRVRVTVYYEDVVAPTS